MGKSSVAVSGRIARTRNGKTSRPPTASKLWAAVLFLGPAALFIGALIIYPTIDTISQSFQNEARQFVGLDNYQEMIDTPRIVTAIKNTFIWVVIAPGLVTGFGLVIAVLTEQVKYTTAIKLVLFMPFAISGLAAGVLWRVTYEPDPERGVLNAAIAAGYNVVKGPGAYPDAQALPAAQLQKGKDGALMTKSELQPGDTATIGLVGVLDQALPPDASQAEEPSGSGDAVSVLVWRDFKPGGGEPGVVEEGEVGLSGAVVELVDDSGDVVATETTSSNGTVSFSGVGQGPFRAQLAASNFDKGFEGISWLGTSLVTPALIAVFFWGSVGLAVVVIGGGLAALPRDLLEAARMDGANEWQNFRYITVPLMRPIIGVVFVTLTINVLKIFDLVWVTAPGQSQVAANVIGVEMFRSAFAARNFGVGAAVAVFLFVLVIPIMIFNLRQFRREN